MTCRREMALAAVKRKLLSEIMDFTVKELKFQVGGEAGSLQW